MNSYAVSQHAQARMQGRAIAAAGIDMLLEFGTSSRVGGADSFYFDQASRRRAASALGKATMRQMAKYLDAYAVVADDGSVITAAWRTRRLHRA